MIDHERDCSCMGCKRATLVTEVDSLTTACYEASAAIRRRVNVVRAAIAVWEPAPYPQCNRQEQTA